MEVIDVDFARIVVLKTLTSLLKHYYFYSYYQTKLKLLALNLKTLPKPNPDPGVFLAF